MTDQELKDLVASLAISQAQTSKDIAQLHNYHFIYNSIPNTVYILYYNPSSFSYS